jgi:hypothetical protein
MENERTLSMHRTVAELAHLSKQATNAYRLYDQYVTCSALR